MFRIFASLVLITFVFTVACVDTAVAGWKENYRNKYSKTGSSPNSMNKRLANMDFTFPKWREPKGRTIQTNDTFSGYTTNFTPLQRSAKARVGEPSGYTLAGAIQEMGNTVANVKIQGNKIPATTTTGAKMPVIK